MTIGDISWYVLNRQLQAKRMEEQQREAETEEYLSRLEAETLRLQLEQSGFREGVDGVNGLSWKALGFPDRLCF